MTSLAVVRQALAAALQPTGLKPYAYVRDSITTPCADIWPENFNYRRTFGNAVHELVFVVRVYASRSDARGGQDRLDAFLDPTGAASVLQALEADPTLGGLVETVRVVDMRDYGTTEVAGTRYYSADLGVTVHVRGA